MNPEIQARLLQLVPEGKKAELLSLIGIIEKNEAFRMTVSDSPFLLEIKAELQRAYAKHGDTPWSRHQAYGIIKEEFDEFWDEIKRDSPDALVLKELIHTATMCYRYAETSFGLYRSPAESKHIGAHALV